MSAKRCLGFGSTEGKCDRVPGTEWSPHWCAECNQARMAYIGAQLKRLVERMGQRQTESR